MRIKETEMPENGLMLLFTPNGPDDYNVQMLLDPTDLTMDETKFYASLGHGLMHLALNNVAKISEVGVHLIMAKQAEEEATNDVSAVTTDGMPVVATIHDASLELLN